ncbi:MAG: MarR family transcriptional regulator [Hydrotalea flava]|uniref:MarR family winged helix-turn-helix transcriptional regulator n=1 Tax=Hydrotalea TaxID=1004300 RepID=UPI0009423015|nr:MULTISPECIES: MarR family transcriptional regulator [Hydrotalea]MBY0348288.1 MarR family transcriptional regulator [Hydrotalea flava]NIM34846.1 MarR family transcriptional regulator [Hydrotalea flava]NIM37676.1 MarR family transcriptional regulator [Hydrotalea flava]NIN02841.1 MarR family transcriptional regulator [Hydrotalea flava]NIN14526.1 MarR family transcriptional regulator [Hydrotalea flava]
MEIEQEIPQLHFRNEHHKAIVNIIFTANWLQEKIRQFLTPEDITAQQYNILRIVHASAVPLSTLQIRAQMLDKMSDTSRMVDRLAAKKLLEKRMATNDKRKVAIYLTAEGVGVLHRIEARIHELDAMVAALSVEDAQLLNGLLNAIR